MSIAMQANVHRLSMQHPADLAGLAALFDSGALAPADVAAVIGKTEGNGGVNDFTRGYFTFALATLLSERLGTSRSEILERIPCVLSGGTEGVLSPHYLVLERRQSSVRAALGPPPSAGKRLAIGVAFTEPMAPEAIGRQAHVDAIAGAVHAAMRDAGIDDVNDIHFVQVKTPCVTVARAAAAAARGASVVSTDANRAMAYARAAGAFGVAAALGEVDRRRALRCGDADGYCALLLLRQHFLGGRGRSQRGDRARKQRALDRRSRHRAPADARCA